MKKYLFLLLFSTFILPIENFRNLTNNIDQSKLKLFKQLNFTVQEELLGAIRQGNLFVLDESLKSAEKGFFKSLTALVKALEKSRKDGLKLSGGEYLHLSILVRDGLPAFCSFATQFRQKYLLLVEEVAFLRSADMQKMYASLSQEGNPAQDIFSGKWAESFCEKLELTINKIEVLANILKPSEVEMQELEEELLDDSSSSASSIEEGEADEDAVINAAINEEIESFLQEHGVTTGKRKSLED